MSVAWGLYLWFAGAYIFAWRHRRDFTWMAGSAGLAGYLIGIGLLLCWPAFLVYFGALELWRRD